MTSGMLLTYWCLEALGIDSKPVRLLVGFLGHYLYILLECWEVSVMGPHTWWSIRGSEQF